MDDNNAMLQRVRSIHQQALALRSVGDPLLAGQVEAIVGRLSALLSVLGDPVPVRSSGTAPVAPTFPPVRLDGRIALVTGGGGGLGTLAACAFAEAGADVVLAARHIDKCEATAEQVRARGRRAFSVAADVTQPDQVEQMVAAALREFGRIDVLFNNAGITSPRTLEESTIDEWWKVVEVNVRGTMLCIKAVAPHMVARRQGRIINMASILAGRGMAKRSAYAASKAGILEMTRALAFELGPFGITVNALGPTVIVTDLNRELVKTQPALYEAIIARTPLGRLGTPEDLAGPLVFLASDAARFVNGQILYVDGGYTAG